MKKVFPTIFAIALAFLVTAPLAFAQLPIDNSGQQVQPIGGANTGGGAAGTDCTKAGDYGLKCAEGIGGLAKGDIPSYVGGILNVVMGVLGSILVALIIYSGILYMTAAGNEKRVETAKTVLTYAIIGIVIVFASYVISQFVISAVATPATTTP